MKPRRRRRPRPWRFALALLAMLAIGAAAGWYTRPRYEARRSRAAAPPASPSAPRHPPPARRTADRLIATLYFARIVGGKERLVPIRRELPSDEPAARAALEELIEGEVPPGCQRPLPEGTRLRGVSVRGGLATADFSRELVANFPGGSDTESVVVYAIVDTLCSLPRIERAQILVEGERLETLGGHIDTSGPLRADEELVVR